jgi:hypothetical protein
LYWCKSEDQNKHEVTRGGMKNFLFHCLYNALGKSLCTYKRRLSIERTLVSKNLNKQLHTLPVLHFNWCLTTEYNETKAHFNGNFNTDNQIYVP